MEVGQYLMIWAKVQGRFYDETQLEVKVQKINLLSEVMENLVKEVSLYLPLEKINQDFTANMNQLTNAYPGKAHLNFYIQFTDPNSEPENREKVLKMSSRSKKVNAEKFVKTIQQDYPFISFKINQ